MSLIYFFILSILSFASGIDVTNVLLFGGNGFIGSHVTQALLKHEETMNITIVSRGNWPYDTAETIQPYVFHVHCDRYQSEGLKGCTEFISAIQYRSFDAVVDFSAYEPDIVKDALNVLRGKIGIYIYISSDSVYEVCETSKHEKSLEEDAIRPLNYQKRSRLAASDSYGDLKLAGEEILASQSEVPYVALRLPDVMGERDSTGRWWFYVLWIELYQFIGEPIPIPPKTVNLTTSYVYAPDVANIISYIILARSDTKIHNQAFNLGFEDGYTLKEIITGISNILNVEIDTIESSGVNMFPSVTRGPVDITKAKKYLNFYPTAWNEALNNTVQFYTKAFHTFRKEKGRIIEKLLRLAVPDRMRKVVITALDARTFEGHDEL